MMALERVGLVRVLCSMLLVSVVLPELSCCYNLSLRSSPSLFSIFSRRNDGDNGVLFWREKLRKLGKSSSSPAEEKERQPLHQYRHYDHPSDVILDSRANRYLQHHYAKVVVGSKDLGDRMHKGGGRHYEYSAAAATTTSTPRPVSYDLVIGRKPRRDKEGLIPTLIPTVNSYRARKPFGYAMSRTTMMTTTSTTTTTTTMTTTTTSPSPTSVSPFYPTVVRPQRPTTDTPSIRGDDVGGNRFAGRDEVASEYPQNEEEKFPHFPEKEIRRQRWEGTRHLRPKSPKSLDNFGVGEEDWVSPSPHQIVSSEAWGKKLESPTHPPRLLNQVTRDERGEWMKKEKATTVSEARTVVRIPATKTPHSEGAREPPPDSLSPYAQWKQEERNKETQEVQQTPDSNRQREMQAVGQHQEQDERMLERLHQYRQYQEQQQGDVPHTQLKEQQDQLLEWQHWQQWQQQQQQDQGKHELRKEHYPHQHQQQQHQGKHEPRQEHYSHLHQQQQKTYQEHNKKEKTAKHQQQQKAYQEHHQQQKTYQERHHQEQRQNKRQDHPQQRQEQKGYYKQQHQEDLEYHRHHQQQQNKKHQQQQKKYQKHLQQRLQEQRHEKQGQKEYQEQLQQMGYQEQRQREYQEQLQQKGFKEHHKYHQYQQQELHSYQQRSQQHKGHRHYKEQHQEGTPNPRNKFPSGKFKDPDENGPIPRALDTANDIVAKKTELALAPSSDKGHGGKKHPRRHSTAAMATARTSPLLPPTSPTPTSSLVDAASGLGRPHLNRPRPLQLTQHPMLLSRFGSTSLAPVGSKGRPSPPPPPPSLLQGKRFNNNVVVGSRRFDSGERRGAPAAGGRRRNKVKSKSGLGLDIKKVPTRSAVNKAPPVAIQQRRQSQLQQQLQRQHLFKRKREILARLAQAERFHDIPKMLVASRKVGKSDRRGRPKARAGIHGRLGVSEHQKFPHAHQQQLQRLGHHLGHQRQKKLPPLSSKLVNHPQLRNAASPSVINRKFPGSFADFSRKVALSNLQRNFGTFPKKKTLVLGSV